MTDDIIRRLREAIAAGPTPGPWFHAYDFGQIGSVENAAGHVILQAQQTAPGREDIDRRNKTAAFIAAASPDNIAALLDRLDAAERENERLRAESKAQLEELGRIDDALGTNEGPSAVDHIMILKTKNERLREDAERYQWLTDDHPRQETRERVHEIASRISVSGKGRTDAAIDAAMAAERGKE